MFNMWPTYDDDEINAAIHCLKSGKVNYWTGEQGRLFEREFAELNQISYAIAVSSGTAALELALYSLDIKPGDEVIVTPRSFIASASCIILRGATPVFADVDPVSQNITASTVKQVLSPRTRAIIAVHHAGWPCDMEPLLDLAEQHNLYIIEDCAQALGARYKGKPVGTFGHMAAFSFCQDKIVSTGGEGGMLVTNSEQLWEKAWSYKDHGKNFSKMHGPKNGSSFRWVHDSFGTNWRMTEMQSAIGRVQLKKLNRWHDQRSDNASVLTQRFSNIDALRVTVPPREIVHAYYKYYVFIKYENLKSDWDRDDIVDAINQKGIPCFTGSCPGIYMENAFYQNGLTTVAHLPVAEWLGETSLMFPVHPTLNGADMHAIADGVEDVLVSASVSRAEPVLEPAGLEWV